MIDIENYIDLVNGIVPYQFNLANFDFVWSGTTWTNDYEYYVIYTTHYTSQIFKMSFYPLNNEIIISKNNEEKISIPVKSNLSIIEMIEILFEFENKIKLALL